MSTTARPHYNAMNSETRHVTRVGFIGLGAMGFGMASHLTKNSKYSVAGYDKYPVTAQRFQAQGGDIGDSPRAVAESRTFLICMVANDQQADDVLFDDQSGAVKSELNSS